MKQVANENTGDAPASAVNEWDQFLAYSRPDIGHKQYSWWADFQTSRRWDSLGVVARDGDAICGGATVFSKSFAPGISFYYIPHGPVLPENEPDAAQLFDDLVKHLVEHQKQDVNTVSHLRMEPRWLEVPSFVHGFREAPGWLEPRNTLCIDLGQSEDEILNQMKKKGRYNIGVARRHGVSVVEDTSDQGRDDFIRLYKLTFQRQGIKRHSTSYFHRLASHLFPHRRGSIFFAEYHGVRLATELVIYAGDTATYKYGGSLGKHRNVMAPYLLHYASMLEAKSRGCRWYDFYGVEPQAKPIAGWENFSSFKRKFGGREIGFVPALDLVFDSDAYREYRNWEKS
jgi:lipid II:glycine glycyltransferase (peptidoglycan interpeptide bridge formation enzyme)